MKISVMTPSVRPEGLDIVKQSLEKQDFPKEDFEWVIVGPTEVLQHYDVGFRNHEIVRMARQTDFRIKQVREREKNEGDFYNLTKSFNDVFKHSSGELCVMYTDMTWIPADTLSNFWQHYQNNPRACVGAVGDQYDPTVVEFGKPQVCVWKDPRKRMDYGSFYEINPVDFEMCLAAIPKQAWLDVGGFDEEYDKGAAVGEKEVCLRMDKAGYKFFLDQSIEYRAIKHGRLSGSEIWDKHYGISCALLQDHLHELNAGTRLKLDFCK